MKHFRDLDIAHLEGAIIIVDVDGTITHDSSASIQPDVLQLIQDLATRNRVYLCSNTKETARIEALSRESGTEILSTNFRKPDARIVDGIPDREGKRLVVIGDKHLTDGRFAQNIGAEFIPVERIRHEGDSKTIIATYVADDLFGYLRLMRPVQWVKNIIVFTPIFFAAAVFEWSDLWEALVVFVAFCAAASTVYIINDIADRDQDRQHPKKKLRPIPSGHVSMRGASVLALVLLVLTAAALSFVPAAAPVIISYVLLSIAYSFYLKHIAILDIVCVAFFYVMRVLAGGLATATYISPWIILCVLFGALVIVIGKRRAEFAHAARRAVLEGYTKQSLDYLLAISATLAVVSYALYSAIGSHSPLAIYSTIFVIIAIFRVVNTIYADSAEAEFPERLLFQDTVALTAGAAWALYMFAILYA